jgi:hypothetical protein
MLGDANPAVNGTAGDPVAGVDPYTQKITGDLPHWFTWLRRLLPGHMLDRVLAAVSNSGQR